MIKRNNKIFLIPILLLVISGCASDNFKKTSKNLSNVSIDSNNLYNEGLKNLENKNYKKAIENFESVKSIYPYSTIAKKSIEKLIEADVRKKQYDDAILNLEELMSIYRENIKYEDLRYQHATLYYIKLQKQLRDQKLISKTADVFSEFIQDFPNSKHSSEMREKLSVLNGRLIYREMEIGYFYEIQRNFLASLKRYLIAYHFSKNNNYRDEILYRIYYCYWIIGLNEEGIKYLNELNKEFPNSRWTGEAKKIK
jgi:outer membrane protein assembly factor BamD